ncbi:Copia protein [Trichinella sp. T9]|nr:Copia protein [Trichinella sp. T9]
MVAYHMNRAPKQKETSTTPYEEWFGKRPPIEHLRAFSCDVYILFPDLHRKKFVPKARKVVFVGYASNYNIFRKHRVDEVTDVKFSESLPKRLVFIGGEEDLNLNR